MKKLIIIVLVFVLTISNSACSNKQTVENSSSEQATVHIESDNSELTNTSEISSKANVTSSKPAVTSRETTTTSKAKTETSSEKVSTSSKKVWVPPEDSVVETKPIIPFSSKPNGGGTAKYMFAEEMCHDPELLAEIEAINEAYNENGLEIYLEGEGNKISIVYKFLQQLDAQTLKPQLEEAVKAQKTLFNEQAEQLQTQVMTKLILGIKYVNADGSFICEVEFPQWF